MCLDINQKINKTSLDLMDKIIQNGHGSEGWEGIEEGWRVVSSFSPPPYTYIYIYMKKDIFW